MHIINKSVTPESIVEGAKNVLVAAREVNGEVLFFLGSNRAADPEQALIHVNLICDMGHKKLREWLAVRNSLIWHCAQAGVRGIHPRSFGGLERTLHHLESELSYQRQGPGRP